MRTKKTPDMRRYASALIGPGKKVLKGSAASTAIARAKRAQARALKARQCQTATHAG